jgi:hypothetical protein
MRALQQALRGCSSGERLLLLLLLLLLVFVLVCLQAEVNQAANHRRRMSRIRNSQPLKEVGWQAPDAHALLSKLCIVQAMIHWSVHFKIWYVTGLTLTSMNCADASRGVGSVRFHLFQALNA